MKRCAITLAAIVGLVGCVPLQQSNHNSPAAPEDYTVPVEEAKVAQYPPKPTDYKNKVKAYLYARLKDPDSALYDDWSLSKAYQGCNPPIYGWMSMVRVNAKNGFGGYTGYQFYLFWHNADGSIIPALELPYKIHPVELDSSDYLDGVLKKPQ